MTNLKPLKSPPPELLDELTSIVGSHNVLREGLHDQTRYLREWRDRYIGRSPLILRPSNTQEVSNILKRCHEAYVGVVPQSGNTGLVGGQIPHETGTEIVLCVDRMQKIKSLDAIGKLIEVEAGVTLAKAQNAARSVDLMLPISIPSEGSACIGGNLATNAGGKSVVGYGSTRNLTLGLEVVLADGSVWSHLPGLVKDNSGYSLKDLFIGSEGTLGVITAATMKLFVLPRGVSVAIISLGSTEDILKLFVLTSQLAGMCLTSFEFMSQDSLLLSLKHGEIKPPFKNISQPCYVIIEVSTSEPDYANILLENILSHSDTLKLAREVCLGSTSLQIAQIWKLRENMSDAQKKEGGSVKHDISLPLSKIPEFLQKAATLVQKICPGARPVPFGHIGDGNIHYNISQPIDINKSQFLEYYEPMTRAIHDLVYQMNGSFAAEHGIGRAKREELIRLKNPIELELMRTIKYALDPRGILNPGKLLSLSLFQG